MLKHIKIITKLNKFTKLSIDIVGSMSYNVGKQQKGTQVCQISI
jgi:hypothetical protein